MGITANFMAISGDDLQRLMDSPDDVDEFILEGDGGPVAECHLDKAIDGIQFLLYAAEVTVALAPTEMPGDPIECGCGEDEISGFDAALVAEVAGRLAATPFDALAPHFDGAAMDAAQVYPAGWDDDRLDYLKTHYVALQGFFAAAADHGLGALLTSG